MYPLSVILALIQLYRIPFLDSSLFAYSVCLDCHLIRHIASLRYDAAHETVALDHQRRILIVKCRQLCLLVRRYINRTANATPPHDSDETETEEERSGSDSDENGTEEAECNLL